MTRSSSGDGEIGFVERDRERDRYPIIAEVVIETADAISRRLGHDARVTPGRARDSAAAD